MIRKLKKIFHKTLLSKILSIGSRTIWSFFTIFLTSISLILLNEEDLALFSLILSIVALPLAFTDSLFGVSNTLKKNRENYDNKNIVINLKKLSLVSALSFIFISFLLISLSTRNSIYLLILVYSLYFAFAYRDYFIRISLVNNTYFIIAKAGIIGIFLLIVFLVLNFLLSISITVYECIILSSFITVMVVFVSSIKNENIVKIDFNSRISFSKNDLLLLLDNLFNWLRSQSSLVVAAIFFEPKVIASIFASRILISPLLSLTPIISSLILPKFAANKSTFNNNLALRVCLWCGLISAIYAIIVLSQFDLIVLIFNQLDLASIKNYLNFWLIGGLLYLISPVLSTLYIGEMNMVMKNWINFISAVSCIVVMVYFGITSNSPNILLGLLVGETLYIFMLVISRFWNNDNDFSRT